MTRGVRTALSLVLIVGAIWLWETIRPIPQPAGVLVPDPPRVSAITDVPPAFDRDEHKLSALAAFDTKARILSTKRYYGRERETRIAPLDLALAWGRLSDSTMLKGVDVAQDARRVLFQSYDPSLSESEMAASLMNVHVIAADEDVEKKLKGLRIGNIVRLEGWLVEAIGRDGWRWKGEMRTIAPQAPGSLLWVRSITVES